MTSDFRLRVLAVVRRIPTGRVATYGDVADLAGSPRASRAVGNILRGCPDQTVPCHRVVGAGGALGGYGGNLSLKRARLRAEGLEVSAERIRCFREFRWRTHANTAVGTLRGFHERVAKQKRNPQSSSDR